MTSAMTNSALELASLSDASMPTEAAEPEVFVFPVSFAQQRLWFLKQLDPDSGQYNMATAVRLQGIVHTPALEQSLEYLTARHESLRTTFRIVADDLMQLVHPQRQVCLAVVDGVGMSANQWQQWLVTAAEQPFDLAQGPLLRVTLLQISPTEHVLLLVMHHIISDGWSLNILVQELATTYAAVIAGQMPTFSELPIQYADFAVWQRDWLEQGERDRQLQYWQQQLQALSSLPLATDFPRPAISTGSGARQTWTISADLTRGLKQLSQQSQATLYMTLLAAWQTLLYRYSGQDDIAVGSPVANRNQAETQGLIGCFVNTLVLRSGIEASLTFRQLLTQVKATVLAAYEHQDLPFETLVETLQLERDLSHNPLFQVWFALNHAPAENLEISGLTWNSLPLARSTTQFDLSLEIVDQEQTLVATLGYSTDLFQNETITRLWHHFQMLLTGILENPDAAIAHLPLLTAPERHQLLIDWNQTEVEYPEACLHQRLQQQATRIPAAIAVRFADQILTYQALEQQANQLAHTLQTQGVQPGTLVGLCVERSPALLIGLLGILKSGAAYVPLDPMYPPERLAGMVNDAQISVLVTQQQWLSLFEVAPRQIATICLDRDQALIAQAPIKPPLTAVTPAHLAYVIYTSGSTGKPKGVQISHRAIVNFLYSMAQMPGLAATDRLLAVTTLAFDIAGLELFLPLWVGAQVVIAPSALTTDGEKLAGYLQEAEITAMQATPATWRLLLASGWQGKADLKILCGGEALTADLAEQLLARGAELWNLYGPTETTVWSTMHRIEAVTPTIPIGKAIANTQLYVLDQQHQPVPIGVPGELYIGGAGLAQGYLHRPELTAEKFIPHPFANSPKAKLYRTGDRVRYRADGTLECLGRLDRQVKLRGFRFELGEIEALLSRDPHVQAAVVTLQQTAAAEHKQLVAYIVPASQPEDWTDETGDRWLQSHVPALQQHLKAQLPYYMVPTGFVALAQLPLTPNGKVNRRSLPALQCWATPSEVETASPQTPIEQLLVKIWAEVLGLPHVGIHDNFFALGGDSILSIQIITRANQVGLRLTPKLLFQHQTIAELATVATATPSAQQAQTLGEDIKIDQAVLNQAMARSQAAQRQAQDAISIYPLSPMQQGLLFHLLYHPSSEAYLNQTWGTLVGPLNVTAFQQAWQQVVDPHAILRTAFVWEQLDAPLQVVYRQVTVPFEQQDWRHLSADEQKQQWPVWLQRDRQQGFNPDQAPLMRVTLIQLADSRYQFVWSHHHLLLDGWSTPLLLKDVLLSYAAYCKQQVPQLPSSPDYGEYIAWLQKRSLEQAESFWRPTLQDFVQPTPLPTGQPPTPQKDSAYAEFEVKLPAETTADLQAWSRQYKITLNTLMQGCWALLLGQGSDRQDIVFGATVSGRPPDLPGADTMIGLFINTLPVRVQISAEMPLLEWLQALQAQQVEARQYEYSPLAQIQRWSQVPQGRPLFNSVLVFENFPTGSDRPPDLQGVQIQSVQSAIRNHYPLTLRVAPQDPISLLWMYDTHQISTPIVQHRAQQLVILLQSIAEQPHTLIQNLLQVLQHSDQQVQAAKAQSLDQVSRTTFQQTRRKAISAS